MSIRLLLVVSAGLMISLQTLVASAEPLKVFLLAGQSNMEGHAKVETFDYIGDDDATAPLLEKMRNPDGSHRVCEGVWISLLTGMKEKQAESFGKLTTGYGARRDPTADGGKIGPEFTFGIKMDEAFQEPVLIIKTAWGGKSLFYDYRPPSAGPYQQTENDRKRDRNPPEQAGHYYREMIQHTKQVLNDISRICPEYDPDQGYELAGFVWFQGFNDMVNRDAYPVPEATSTENRFANYSKWLADLIRDVRKDLEAPEMPAVIGVMGVGGKEPNEGNAEFRKAMAATADYPDLTSNVVAIETSKFWDEPLAAIAKKRDRVKQMRYFLRKEHKNHANKDGKMTQQEQNAYVANFEAELISPEEAEMWQRGASNAGYHYLGCAKTFALMGDAFATAILELRDQ